MTTPHTGTEGRVHLRISVDLPEHPSVVVLSDRAFRALIIGMFAGADVPRFTPAVARELRAAGWLTDAGTIRRNDLWRTVAAGVRSKIPDSVRHAIYERDGFACLRCGAGEHLSLDHIFPWSLGGSDEPENLQTLCLPCNQAKSARVEVDI